MSLTITETRSFIPTQLPGCQLWLDSMDASTFSFSSGTSVSQWRDKSGNDRHGNLGSSPTYSGNGVVFGGAQHLFLANAAGLFANTAFHIFCVEKVSSGGVGYLIGDEIVNGGGSQNGSLHIGYRTNANLTFAFYSNDLEITGLSGNPTRIWGFNLPQTNNRNVNLNGTLVGTLGNSTRLSTATTLTIGRSFGANQYNGTIFEMIGFVGELTTIQQQQIEGYLASKWGLQANLPNDHPFRTIRLYVPPRAPLAFTVVPYFTAFRPTQIPGCAVWLDAADASTFSYSGNFVTQWRDKSGNARHMNSSGSITYNTSQRRIELNGATNSFFTGAIASSGISNPSYVIVSRQIGGLGPLFTRESNEFGYFPSHSNGTLYLQSADAAWATIPSPVTNNMDFIHSIVYDASTVNLWLSGTNVVNSSRTAFTTSSLDIGTRRQNGELMTGYIYEFIVFNTTLTAAQRQQLESYLAQKWGLESNLPVNHLHRSRPAGLPILVDQIIRNIRSIPAFIIGNAIEGVDYTITTVGVRTFYTFLATGKTMTVRTSFPRVVDYFAIGGGGAGGNDSSGGGGAGGLQQATGYTLPAGTYNLVIGTGGNQSNKNGGNTVFAGITAIGGGAGGDYSTAGSNGGCGGGGGGSLSGFGVGNQGFSGGSGGSGAAAGGGGGIGGTGVIGGGTTLTSVGGVGITYNGVGYGGGGGGGQGDGSGGNGGLASHGGGAGNKWNGSGALSGGFAASANTGGGGGGSGNNGVGGSGGSGIFILSIKTPSSSIVSRVIFNAIGDNQNFVVPPGKTSIFIRMWGAGGGADLEGYGGAGAYVEGTLAVTPGELLTIMVGSGGTSSTVYGGGGSPSIAGNAGGGGRSAICRGSVSVPANNIVVAGGGGGGRLLGTLRRGGGRAVWVGDAEDGASDGLVNIQGKGGKADGTGGLAGSGGVYIGTNGQALLGGNGGEYCAGGGGGWGGGGASSVTSQQASSAGGGSSRIALLTDAIGINSPNGFSAPAQLSPFWTSPIAAGGRSGSGGAGRVVIEF